MPSLLRSLLLDANYTPQTLRDLLHVQSIDDVGLLNHEASVRRIMTERSSAAVLTRLFFLEEPEAEGRARRALGAELMDQLRSGGWVRRERGSLRARLRIDPVGERYFASDLRFRNKDAAALGLPRGDEVYPPSSDSLLLSQVVGAAGRGRVLDLCTGSGVQALAQAGNAAAVVAVDVNPRAVAVAALNGAINGVTNVECREGDLYSPVRGERFDLIIANPPFVTSPYDDGPSFHAGGATGDRVLRRVIRGWRAHLAPRGRAFAVSHVGVRRGERLEDVARRWFAAFPGQALVLVCETGTAVDLAAAQALFALSRGLAAYEREVGVWHDYLRRHRIESVSLILIAARRGGRPKVEVVDASPRVLPLPLTPGPAERIETWLKT